MTAAVMRRSYCGGVRSVAFEGLETLTEDCGNDLRAFSYQR